MQKPNLSHMPKNPSIKFTINFNDPDLDAEERDEQAQKLIAELRQMDEVETVSRVLDPNPPEGNKALGGFLVGKLATEVKSSNINPLFRLLGERYAHKLVEMEIEVDNRKMKVTATSQEELIALLPTVQQFLSQQAGASLSSAHTILIFAANPRSTSQLRLDQEVRDIGEGLRLASHRDQFVLESRWAVRPRDMHRAILDKHPRIVHFCGHSEGNSSFTVQRGGDSVQDNDRKLTAVNSGQVSTSTEGLVLEDETGQVKLVDGTALASLFKLFADQVECVVLNSCYSEVQAKAIAQYIPYVIGMNQAIGDRAAIEFAVGFYDALGAGRSIEFAYELGCAAIQMAGISEHLTPVLIKKLE
jgi:CHAT domain